MRNHPRRLASFIGLALAALLAACGVNEEDASDLGTVWVPTDIVGADIDGNGRIDVVTIGSQQDSASNRVGYLRIHRQSLTGSFTTTQLQVGRYPWRLQVADVNGDGAADLLVLDAVGTGTAADDVLYLVPQDANNRGQFLAPRAIASGLVALDFTLADANLDLATDIVIAGIAGGGTGATQLLQNRTQPGFFLSPTVLPIAGRLQKVTTGNYRGSGRADLVSYATLDGAAANSPGQLVVNTAGLLPSLADAGFYQMPGTVLASHTGVNAQTLAVTDVDVDGLADVVACFTPVSTAFQPKISVVVQRLVGDPVIVDTSLEGIRGLDSFVVADLNGNGVADVAATGFYPVGSPSTVRSTTNILAPLASGRYVLVSSIDMPISMSRINAADVDGDGLNDLLLLGDRQRAFVMFQSGAARGTFLAPREL